ncbi:hypothetical protein HPB48_004797 [Haemaphysalis longicornis]|uniref:Uncharacterized protein n=1 Tax=Haemaphysalis longicornis TaxID=44386 RepID=A0A9J6FE55_HAELO|nr:hypothetical protein HPB48_004797 [Haemaphysalis longicornis]
MMRISVIDVTANQNRTGWRIVHEGCRQTVNHRGRDAGIILFPLQLHSASAAIAVGYQHGYRTARAALAHIYRTQGVWNGLWRATSTNMLRLSVGSALQLSTFTAFKTLLNTAVEGRERYFVVNTLLAAFLSGVTVAPPVAFLDGLRARLYAQPSNPSGEGIYYNGLRDCVIKVKQTEGLRALARGAGGAFFYIMTSSVVTLVTWEEIKGRRDKNRTQKQDLLVDYGII